VKRKYNPSNLYYGACPFCGEDYFDVREIFNPTFKFPEIEITCKNCGAKFSFRVIREPNT